MFGLSFGKILVIVLVIVAAWRGMRLLKQVQDRLAEANQPPVGHKAKTRAQAATTDLVECPRCGTFVPNGTICRSREECVYRRA